MLGRRTVAFFVFMGIFSAVYQLGSMAEVSEQEAAMFMEEFEKLVKDIDGAGIFFHNILIALPMFLPGFGIAWGLFSAGSTGYAFAAIVSTAPELAQVPPLAILYLSPFGLMELVAYSLATSRSYMLVRVVTNKVELCRQAMPTAAEIGAVVGLLLAGGFLEHYMIGIAMEEGFSLPGM